MDYFREKQEKGGNLLITTRKDAGTAPVSLSHKKENPLKHITI